MLIKTTPKIDASGGVNSCSEIKIDGVDDGAENKKIKMNPI